MMGDNTITMKCTLPGGDVDKSIHLYYDRDMNYLGMFVFVNGAHDQNLSEEVTF
jgi:hypothetical protein